MSQAQSGKLAGAQLLQTCRAHLPRRWPLEDVACTTRGLTVARHARQHCRCFQQTMRFFRGVWANVMHLQYARPCEMTLTFCTADATCAQACAQVQGRGVHVASFAPSCCVQGQSCLHRIRLRWKRVALCGLETVCAKSVTE